MCKILRLRKFVNIIGCAFFLSLLSMLVSCSDKKDGKIESSVATFNECIYPRGAVIYRNYLIIVGENTSPEDTIDFKYYKLNVDKCKLFVYNLETDNPDQKFQRKLYTENLKWLFVRNDTLFGRFRTEIDSIDLWSFWNGKNWVETNPFAASAKFETSYLRKECGNIFEDNKYIIYSYHQGEFGNAVLFLDKATGIIRGYPLVAPRQVIKDSTGYIIYGRLDHITTIYDVIHLSHPENLPIVPDSLIMYHYNWNKDSVILLYIDHYFRSQISSKFENDNIAKTQDELWDYKCFNIFESNRKYLIYDSLTHSKNDVINLIRQENTNSVCEAVFKYQSQLYCIMTDRRFWYLCVMNNLNPEIIRKNYFLKINEPRFCQIRKYFGNSFLFSYCYSDPDSPCLKFTCLIINDQYIKTYHFIPDQN